jgi:hypothetical protein
MPHHSQTAAEEHVEVVDYRLASVLFTAEPVRVCSRKEQTHTYTMVA